MYVIWNSATGNCGEKDLNIYHCISTWILQNGGKCKYQNNLQVCITILVNFIVTQTVCMILLPLIPYLYCLKALFLFETIYQIHINYRDNFWRSILIFIHKHFDKTIMKVNCDGINKSNKFLVTMQWHIIKNFLWK